MVNRDFFSALEQLEREHKLNQRMLLEALEVGMAAAFKRETGEGRAVAVKISPERGAIEFYAYQTVVDGEPIDETQLTLDEAQDIKPDAKIGEVIGEDVSPKQLSRIAAQAAKQIILQKINDAKKDQARSDMSNKEGELMQSIVRRVDPLNIYVEIVGTQMEGVMGSSDRVPGEKLKVGDRVKVYIKKVRDTTRGTHVSVSRSCAGYVRKLFEIEVPELRGGLVKVKNIVREASYRTKMAVYSEDPNIDSIGSCIGTKGTRINTIVNELSGEKVDVILYCDDPSEYIARALSPAKVLMVQLNETERIAKVVVPDDKLSLAIGRSGQNARLAARLTGFKIDVKPYSAIMSSLDQMNDKDEQSDADNEVTEKPAIKTQQAQDQAESYQTPIAEPIDYYGDAHGYGIPPYAENYAPEDIMYRQAPPMMDYPNYDMSNIDYDSNIAPDEYNPNLDYNANNPYTEDGTQYIPDADSQYNPDADSYDGGY